MNGLKNIRSCKRLAWVAVLSGAMVVAFSLAAFGQQEVDPTWYDPWAPKAPVIQSAQPVVFHTAENTAGHTAGHPIEPTAEAAVVAHHAKGKSVSSSSSSSSTSTKRVAKTSARRAANQGNAS